MWWGNSRPRCVLFVSLFLALGVGGSSCVGQARPEARIVEVSDLSYVSPADPSDSLRMLNLVWPAECQNCPLLVWIGGGAWSYVDRHVEMELARKLAAEGVAVASIGHRLSAATWKDPSLSEGVQHPTHIQDLASAVRWLVEHADEYPYDNQQLFIGGYSSGAHLAALLVMDHTYLQKEGVDPSIFKGVLPFSGAYDIEDYHRVLGNGSRPELAVLHVEAVFGPPEGFEQASPVSYLQSLNTPMLLVSDNDLYNYTRLFEERIRETEFRQVQVAYAYEFSHSGLWRDMARNDTSDYRNMMVRFIKRHAGQLE